MAENGPSISGLPVRESPARETRGFSYKGKTLLSAADPEGRASRAADSVEIADGVLYLCPSPLYGHGLARLLARLAGFPGSALLCVEAEPELFALSLENLDEALRSHPRLRLTDRATGEELCALARREWGLRAFKSVKLVKLNGGWRLHAALYETLAQTLQNGAAVEWGNAITMLKLGRTYIRNAIRNLALVPNRPSLDAAGLSFGDRPVLALGAGPSLCETLDGLSASFGDGLSNPESRPFGIVCVDTCLPVLRARGITPDLAVILECQHWNLEDFVGLSGWEVPAAMDLSALPRSGGVLAGGLCLFFTPWARLRVFERLGAAGLLPSAMPPLGSVGLSMAAAALRLGKGPVVTAGLDFSFTPDMFHARSSPGHKAKLRRQNRFTGILNEAAAFGGSTFAAVSRNGGKTLSNPGLRNYRDLFERELAPAGAGGSPRLFAVADGGLPLGVPSLPPQEAFDVLASGGPAPSAGSAKPARPGENPKAETLAAFSRAELARLSLLRNMLAGSSAMDAAKLCLLIDECDYLWAHFPDRAAGRPRPALPELEAGDAAAVSFLKRLRVEIDPFCALWKALAKTRPS